MNATQIHNQAWLLRTKIFELTNEIKVLQLEAHKHGGLDNEADELDSIACRLATIHEDLPYVFIAASSD